VVEKISSLLRGKGKRLELHKTPRKTKDGGKRRGLVLPWTINERRGWGCQNIDQTIREISKQKTTVKKEIEVMGKRWKG